jgi:Leucine-rich repeat (LRR) protein
MGSYFSQVLHEANLSGGRSLTVYSTKAKKEEDHYTKRLVAALPHLENLSVEKCKLKILPPILATLQELRSLSLVDNELRAFPVLKVGLKRLILSRNSLPFPLEVLDLPSLEVLDLSFNEITSVPESLPAKLSNLVRLNLSHNKLSEFPTSVLSLSNITSLDLSFCNLNGQLPAPEALGKLKRNLKELNLAGNGLTHLHGVENLHNVEVLSLGRCVFERLFRHVPSTGLRVHSVISSKPTISMCWSPFLLAENSLDPVPFVALLLTRGADGAVFSIPETFLIPSRS